MSLIDNQYVRRYRQHIPFYKSDFPVEDRRIYWHHARCLCETDCIFGIPIVEDQYIMFEFEDPAATGVTVNPFGPSANATITLCCLDEDDTDICTVLSLTDNVQSFAEHKICIIDGQPIQFNYLRFQLPEVLNCGIYYFRITAYSGVNQRVFYSQPVEYFNAQKAIDYKLTKLNINDKCTIGGINWSQIYEGWGNDDFIDGFEVYLPRQVAASFVEEISDREVEEDGRGNEIKIFEKTDWRYQFDTGFVPDHYAEFIKELSHTSNNSITIRDRQAVHQFKIDTAETTITPDDEGCYMNVNVNFLVNTYSSDSCCSVMEDCECPSDDAIQAISYTTDQVDAETDVNEGDAYIVPNNGSAPTNPNWSSQDNKIAVWNGTDWDYTNNTVGSYVYVQDQSDYFLSLGVADIWVPNDAIITNIVEVGGGSCQVTVNAVIPNLSWAKIQYSPAGAGTWSDLDGVHYSLSQWQVGQTFSIGIAGNYDFRLVHLDTGCDLDNSPIFSFTTTESCV